jgi:hypothetical protein
MRAFIRDDPRARARLMREARSILTEYDPDLVVEGKMWGDAALPKAVLDDVFPGSRLSEPSDHAKRRRCRHLLQSAEDRGWQWHHGETDAPGHREACA